MSESRPPFRVIVVGLGVQGRKRLSTAGPDAVGAVDPVEPDADYKRIEDVPTSAYDAALVCVPDAAKLDLLPRLLSQGKHVLVEKPLLSDDEGALRGLSELARSQRAVCYTAYNHRFEPHFVRMKELIASGRLGRIYLARLFYGNGTAREVRGSPWRDRGAGVLPDLGSHLLDTVLFWFKRPASGFRITGAYRFENRAFDHVAFRSDGPPVLELEMSLLSWRNSFTADLYGEEGSAHIESLCKWGPSSLRIRSRVLPSGRPPEETVTLVRPDPTWTLEYEHFKRLCAKRTPSDPGKDLWLAGTIRSLCDEALRWSRPTGSSREAC
ncbi:MAG: Gfo/Idh/MocA family oxidoreductase [Myxococcota bacterium]